MGTEDISNHPRPNFWTPPHYIENVGDAELLVIVVELKQPQAAAGDAGAAAATKEQASGRTKRTPRDS